MEDYRHQPREIIIVQFSNLLLNVIRDWGFILIDRGKVFEPIDVQ